MTDLIIHLFFYMMTLWEDVMKKGLIMYIKNNFEKIESCLAALYIIVIFVFLYMNLFFNFIAVAMLITAAVIGLKPDKSHIDSVNNSKSDASGSDLSHDDGLNNKYFKSGRMAG